MVMILLVDDDELLAGPLGAYLQRFDMQLVASTRPSLGLAWLRGGQFDAAILDVMLPEMDGFALCRTIRQESDIPIIMLTARGDVMDRVVGLELGADDYLPKPFEPRELVARLQTVLRRRRGPATGQRLVFDGLEIDLDKHTVLRLGVQPDGWRDRVVPFIRADADPSTGAIVCPTPIGAEAQEQQKRRASTSGS